MHPGSERGAVGESCGAGNTIPVCEVRSGNCWEKRSQRRTPSTVRNHLSFWLQKNHTGVEEYGLDEFAQMLRHDGDVDALRTAAVTHDVARSSTSITTIINISRTLASPMRCKNASRRKNYNFSLDTTRAVTAAPASLAVEPSVNFIVQHPQQQQHLSSADQATWQFPLCHQCITLMFTIDSSTCKTAWRDCFEVQMHGR